MEQLHRKGVQIIDRPYYEKQLQQIAPDVVLPEGIAYTHRQTADGDIYFLSNQQDKAVTFQPVFRAQQQQAVCYNPVNDELVTYDNGNLTLPPYGSLFVIYGQVECFHRGNSVFPAWKQSVSPMETLFKPYTLLFRESGLKLKKQRLFDWSKHEDEKIRYFSGHCRYTTTLKLKKGEVPEKRAWLSFPNVRDIAHVWVNGRDCGIAWTAPYEVEITGALHKGKNTIEIEVVNTWHNALQGADQGKAPYDGIWTNAKYRTKGDQLLPAGLLASPELKIEQ
jgi:hypothetical protein